MNVGIFDWITLVSSMLLIVLVLLQTRGTDLGAAFGGSNTLHVERRGAEKILFQATILTAVVFVGSILASLV